MTDDRLDDELLSQRLEIRNLADENAELTAEVERRAADRAALLGRLEALTARWHAERNALVRQADKDDTSEYLSQDWVGAEMLLECIKELEGAIKGE